MEDVILRFAASARAAGLRISPAEVLGCLALMPRVDILDEAQFAAVLRTHFAKSRLERARFEHVYHLFFHELREDLDAASTAAAEHLQTLRQEITTIEPRMPAMTALADFIAGEPEAFLRLLQEIRSEGDMNGSGPRGKGSNLGGLVRRLPVLRAIQRVRERADAFLDSRWRTIDWETRQDLKRHLDRRLESARRLLAENRPAELTPPESKGPAAGSGKGLGDTPFANLSPGEMVRMREVISRLVRRLRDMAGLRFAARSRGIPDIRRTLRAATRTQGIPLAMKFRKKPPRKSRILVLCDVSGSVWSSARFMLTMLYLLQDCFDRVRSFVFVDEPVEVTRFFDDFEIDRALAEILDCKDVTYSASTDYGRTLRLFKARHLDAVTKKTTVIVIGDGRTNYGNPEEAILEEVRNRSRRLLWLNPESEAFWNSGDSEMRTYQVLCNEVRHCQNLNQLSAFIQDLIL